MDLALPSDVPLADLVPTLLQLAGEELADEGAVHGGWALTRLGGQPLDGARTAAQLELRDGDMLYFTPRARTAPEVVFDDVVDAVATATNERAGRWRLANTRRFAVSFAVAALLGGALAVLFAGPPQLFSGMVGLGMGVLLLVGAAIASRAGGDSYAGTLFGLVALVYGGIGGLLILAGDRTLADLAAPHVLLAATALVVHSSIATVAVGDGAPFFLATAVVGTAIGLGAGVCLLFGTGPAGAAAVIGAGTFAAVPALPLLAYRLARLPIPSIPTGPDDLKADAETVDGHRTLLLSDRADRFLTSLVGMVAAVVLGAVLLVAIAGGVPGAILATVLSLLLLLRARPFRGPAQRLPLLVAGAVGLGIAAVDVFANGSTLVRLGAVLGGAVAAAGISLGYGLAVAGRRISPLWGRLLDIMEIALIVSVVPLAAWVCGLYGWISTIRP
jgi:type VII secretion integral membrane protein EccD